MLHLVFQSPINPAVLARVGTGDDVLFLENATLGLLKNGRLAGALSDLGERCRLYVLADELATRGLADTGLVVGIEVISYAQFVELTVNNPTVQTWA